jgi:hypothetical protein
MATDIRKPLQSALSRLKVEKDRIDRQIEAIEGVLRMNGSQPEAIRHQVSRKQDRKSMSAAARRSVSRRMKAYWAKRKGAIGRRKAKAA